MKNNRATAITFFFSFTARCYRSPKTRGKKFFFFSNLRTFFRVQIKNVYHLKENLFRKRMQQNLRFCLLFFFFNEYLCQRNLLFFVLFTI